MVEATTIQDPIGFATTLEDENGPLWGERPRRDVARLPPLDRRARDGRTTTTTAACTVDEDGAESFEAAFTPAEHARMDGALDFSSRRAARGRRDERPAGRGLITTHVQGTCRMGSDPERSAVDADGQSWDVKRLYVGDGSLVPRTLSVNPSLTIMALADRLAAHLHDDPHGYLS